MSKKKIIWGVCGGNTLQFIFLTDFLTLYGAYTRRHLIQTNQKKKKKQVFISCFIISRFLMSLPVLLVTHCYYHCPLLNPSTLKLSLSLTVLHREENHQFKISSSQSWLSVPLKFILMLLVPLKTTNKSCLCWKILFLFMYLFVSIPG